jgi:hypothetical protein
VLAAAGLLAAPAVAGWAAPAAAAGPATADHAVIGAARDPAGAAGCRMLLLPQPPAPRYSAVTAGDPSGRYLVGYSALPGAKGTVLLLWVDGRLRRIRLPQGLPAPTDVNSSGVIVGQTLVDGRSTGWRYERGRFTALPGLTATDEVNPLAINARGDTVGLSVDPADSVHPRLVLWPAGRRTAARELITPVPVHAADIDDDGTVVASSFTGESRSFIWPRGGGVRPLRSPVGGLEVTVTHIRSGWVAGSTRMPDAVGPLSWRPRGGQVNRVGLAAGGGVDAVNRHGDLAVSRSEDAPVIAHRDGRLVPLPGLAHAVAANVAVLADGGLAAGVALSADTAYAVIWRDC